MKPAFAQVADVVFCRAGEVCIHETIRVAVACPKDPAPVVVGLVVQLEGSNLDPIGDLLALMLPQFLNCDEVLASNIVRAGEQIHDLVLGDTDSAHFFQLAHALDLRRFVLLDLAGLDPTYLPDLFAGADIGGSGGGAQFVATSLGGWLVGANTPGDQGFGTDDARFIDMPLNNGDWLGRHRWREEARGDWRTPLIDGVDMIGVKELENVFGLLLFGAIRLISISKR